MSDYRGPRGRAAQNHASAASKTDDKERLGWAPGVGRGRGIPKQENTRKVKIPSECAGMVIGKAGAKIRELKETSGAIINIPSRENRGSEVEVELSGTEQQMNKAQDLIEKLTLTGKHKIDDVKDESTAASGGGGATFWGSANYGAPVEDKFEDAEKEEEEELIDWGAALRECNEAQKLKWSKLPELIKDFYKEHSDVIAMSDEEVRDFRRDNNNIEVKNFKEDDDTPLLKPVTKFHHAFHNFPDIMATINKQGFDKPSPIQCQAWPYLLAGKDCIGIAQTGTGKTLAFLMPAFIHIDSQPTPRGRRGGPNVLVLSPTRELALQIAQEVKKYEYHGIKSVCIYGGGSRKDQCKVVTDGVEVIIATPGRLNDLVEAGFIAVESITYLVLDEADRMLDMGFEPQIRKVLLDIRPDRQMLNVKLKKFTNFIILILMIHLI